MALVVDQTGMGWNGPLSDTQGMGESAAAVTHFHWPGRLAMAALATLLLLVALNFFAIDVMHSTHAAQLRAVYPADSFMVRSAPLATRYSINEPSPTLS